MSELEEALKFIKKIERENPGRSLYEIANKLRGYTRKHYTTKLWSAATGYNQAYVEGEFQGKLNQEELLLSGKNTDFGHFIASLSDQIDQPGVKLSDLTSWTGDHTSWAGDIGSAIVVYHTKRNTIPVNNLEDALDKFSRDSDYRADIAAYIVGLMINSGSQRSISRGIECYNAIPYSQHVRTFLKRRLRGIIEGNTLKNPTYVEAEIRRAVSTFIRSSNAPDVFRTVKNLLELQPKLELENVTLPSAADLLQGSLHFLTHMIKEGDLESLNFKPYELPEMPSQGTVNYEVKVLS